MNTNIRTNSFSSFIVILLLLSGVTQSMAQSSWQTFPKGKIYLKSGGMILEGKELQIAGEVASLTVAGSRSEYKLADIQLIEAKKGKAKQFGSICGGSCLALSLVSILSTGGETQDEYGNTVENDMGTLVLGSMIWGGIFYGGGYLFGTMMDSWETVYMGS